MYRKKLHKEIYANPAIACEIPLMYHKDPLHTRSTVSPATAVAVILNVVAALIMVVTAFAAPVFVTSSGPIIFTAAVTVITKPAVAVITNLYRRPFCTAGKLRVPATVAAGMYITFPLSAADSVKVFAGAAAKGASSIATLDCGIEVNGTV